MHRRTTKTILELIIVSLFVLFVLITIYGDSFRVFLSGSSEAQTSQGYVSKLVVIGKIFSIIAVISMIILGAFVLVRAVSRL